MQQLPIASLAGLLFLAAPAVGQVPCGSFTSTPVPMDPSWWEAEFKDVTTLPDGTAWASGSYTVYTAPADFETFTLAMRWDGSQWSHVPTPSPSPYPGGTQAYLHAIGAVSPNDVWAAGERYGDAGGLSVGAWIMVQHWDGSSWQVVPTPAPPGGVSINFSGTRVHDIVAIAEDDVWFGGQWGEPNTVGSVTWRPLAMHWNGSSLSIYDTPAPYENFYGFRIASMSAVSSDDIWAVCQRLTAGGHANQFVVLHWDGSSWDQVSINNTGGMRVLYTVEAVAADDVWIFGEDEWPSGPGDVFALHYDGSSWTELTGAPPARGSFALGPDELYVGAGYNIGHGVSLFDGAQHTVVEDFPGLNVHVFEGERGPGCSGWMVGREMVGGKKPFAAQLFSSCQISSYCATSPNSVGAGATLGHSGGASVAANSLVLQGSSLPPNQFGVFYYGSQTTQQPFGDGFRCVAGNTFRLPVVAISGAGAASHALDIAAPPHPSGQITAGSTWNFQFWYRDPAAGGSGFNFSDALQVVFCD